MAEDKRQSILRRYVLEMVALESQIEAALARQRDAIKTHGEVAPAVERFQAMARSHHDALQAYLEATSASDQSDNVIGRLPFPRANTRQEGEACARGIAGTLREDFAAFSYAAISYGELFEVSLRLCDQPLRELAPKYLKAYAEAAWTVNQLMAGVVAWELESEGLSCSCLCPMCSVGACGCVFLGALTLKTAWGETSTGDDAAEGFLLQTPRPGSPLALLGVQGGEHLLSIDGQKVRVNDDVQDAIREHQRGEGMEFLIQHGSDRPRKIAVSRVDQAN